VVEIILLNYSMYPNPKATQEPKEYKVAYNPEECNQGELLLKRRKE
jgi:hypothetical protein